MNEKTNPPNESETFQSVVRKLMQVPQHELKEKIKEEKNKKGDRASDEENTDRPSEES